MRYLAKLLPFLLILLISASVISSCASCGDDDDDDSSSDDTADDDDDDSDDDSDDDDDTGDGEDYVETTLIVDDQFLDPWQFAAGPAGGNMSVVWFYNDGDNEDYRFYFLRSSDTKGIEWPDQNDSVQLPTGGERVHMPQLLQLADGTPMVFCSYGENGYLAYMKARDTAGTDWDDPVIIDDTNYGAGGANISATLADDIPAVIYNVGSTDGLVYARAEDTSGDSWNEPLAVAESVGEWGKINDHHMTIINGRPAVAYQDWDTMDHIYNVYYVRASDAKGDAWENPVAIDDSGDRGYSIDLNQFGEAPLMLYGSESGEVVTVLGADADGDTWDDPFVLPDFRGFNWQMLVYDPDRYNYEGELMNMIIASHWEPNEKGDNWAKLTASGHFKMERLMKKIAAFAYGEEYAGDYLALAKMDLNTTLTIINARCAFYNIAWVEINIKGGRITPFGWVDG